MKNTTTVIYLVTSGLLLLVIGAAIVLAVFSSMAAGLYPTWRGCGVQPAAQLKLQ